MAGDNSKVTVVDHSCCPGTMNKGWKRRESSININLANRTTLHMSLTKQGKQLLENLYNSFDIINIEIYTLNIINDNTSVTIFFNSGRHAVHYVL